MANRLYGSTKVGVVGERPTANDAPPTCQHDPHAYHGRADHVSQLARPQFMRREAAFSSTAGTNVPVPEPFSRILSHGRIMLLDSLCQIHDTSLCFVLLERGFHDTASLLSFAPRRKLGRAGGRGGVPDVIYRGGVEGAQSGGVPRGQIIRSVGRLILSANLHRRTAPGRQCAARGGLGQRRLILFATLEFTR